MFDDLKGKLGFGAMRLPMVGKDVDLDEFAAMADRFLEAGFNYFDTAHGYLEGKSEPAIREAVSKRHPRESFLLADKLSGGFFDKEEDIEPLFFSQLEACGVEYFDNYLMHAQSSDNYEKYKRCNAYGKALELKRRGYIRHVGFSFHDTPEFLEKIIAENPFVEFVQLQVNYLDMDNPSVQARGCMDVARRHHLPVIVMEPVKGGRLANLLPELRNSLAASPAETALRYAAGLDGVALVLSGMSTTQQMEENIRTFSSLEKLADEDLAALKKIVSALEREGSIACTSCHYCTEVCPRQIPIPDIFSVLNRSSGKEVYEEATKDGGKASSCLKCGKCEKVCPQHLPIRKYLEEAAGRYEKRN